MKVKYKKSKDELSRPVTMGLLLEYTDEFLIPKFSQLMDNKVQENNKILENNLKDYIDKNNAKQEYNMKDYFDRKMPQYMTDAFKKLEKTF